VVFGLGQSAAQAVSITQSICIAAGIDKEQWSNIFFECGCQYAEMSAPSKSIAQAWLTQKEFGFWADWMFSYIKDDEWLMEHKVGLNPRRYQQIKFDFLKSNYDEKNKH
jgi:hypothetical protein